MRGWQRAHCSGSMGLSVWGLACLALLAPSCEAWLWRGAPSADLAENRGSGLPSDDAGEVNAGSDIPKRLGHRKLLQFSSRGYNIGYRARAAHKMSAIAKKYTGQGKAPIAKHSDRLGVGYGGQVRHGHDIAADYQRAKRQRTHHSSGWDPDRGRMPKGAGFYKHMQNGHKTNKAGWHKYVNTLATNPHKIARWRNQVDAAHKLGRAGVKGHRDGEHSYDKYHPLHVPRHKLPDGTNEARGRRKDPIRSAVNYAKGVRGREARGHARHAAAMSRHNTNMAASPDHSSKKEWVAHHRSQIKKGIHKTGGDPIIEGTGKNPSHYGGGPSKVLPGKRSYGQTHTHQVLTGTVELPSTAGTVNTAGRAEMGLG